MNSNAIALPLNLISRPAAVAACAVLALPGLAAA
jgi:hypothetical protein